MAAAIASLKLALLDAAVAIILGFSFGGLALMNAWPCLATPNTAASIRMCFSPEV
jgi:hypothetical protein